MIKSSPVKTWTFAALQAAAAVVLLVGATWAFSPNAPVTLSHVGAGLLAASAVATFVTARRISDFWLLAQAVASVVLAAVLVAADQTSAGVFLSSVGFLRIAFWIGFFYSPRMVKLCFVAEAVAVLVAVPFSHDPVQTLVISAMFVIVSGLGALTISRITGELRNEARMDQLAGLQNRHGINEALGRLDWRRQGDQPVSLVLFDLDGLKLVNDRDGHVAGDELLAKFAAELSDAARTSDVTARIGGDEFVVILPGASDQDAHHWVAGIREHTHIPWSFGIAERQHSETFESWLSRADARLYEAKTHAKATAEREPLVAEDIRISLPAYLSDDEQA